MAVSSESDRADLARQAVASNPFWYHTMTVAPGVTTPGWFDQRPVVDRLPWPDVRGKRCLDVGTADGFLAFELERRGAAEVVATDVSDHALWDHPAHLRRRGVEFWVATAGEKKGQGFRIARDLLDSTVELIEVSAYELTPDSVGKFDVVVCGALLLHLRDPVGALEAMRSVCTGHLMLTNQVAPSLALVRRPLAAFEGMTDHGQWWLPNPAANRQLVESAGFSVLRDTGVYPVPSDPAIRPVHAMPRLACDASRDVSSPAETGCLTTPCWRSRREPAGWRMRIALTHAFCWPEVRRGAERFLPSLAAALARRGHDVVHYSSAWSPGRSTDDGVTTVKLRRRFRDQVRHETHFGLRMTPRLAAGGFDAVHSLGRHDALAADGRRRCGRGCGR